jgi:hypothetical protein
MSIIGIAGYDDWYEYRKPETKKMAVIKIAQGMDADETWLEAENIVKGGVPSFKDILKSKIGG